MKLSFQGRVLGLMRQYDLALCDLGRRQASPVTGPTISVPASTALRPPAKLSTQPAAPTQTPPLQNPPLQKPILPSAAKPTTAIQGILMMPDKERMMDDVAKRSLTAIPSFAP